MGHDASDFTKRGHLLLTDSKGVYRYDVNSNDGHRGAIAFFCDGPGRDTARCREAHARWQRVRAHARLLERYAGRMRALYAAGLPVAARERVRARLAARAADAVRRRGLGSPDELSPPNNARLLAMLAYETDLAAFERLVPGAGALPAAIDRIVEAARGARDPFAAVRALERPTLQTQAAGLDSIPPWRLSLLPSIRCSDVSPGGSASWGTTSPTGRTCTGPAWRPARGATAG